MRQRPRGYTILELLVVVGILGIIAAVVIPRFFVSADEAKKNSCARTAATINTQVERWFFEKGYWPKDNVEEEIGKDLEYFPDGNPICPVDGSKYVLDNTSHRVTGHKH